MSFEGKIIGGKYRIETKLGEGGMGVVYRATQLSLRRSVAIKFLREDLSMQRSSVERFHREARIAGSLGHENLTSVLDVDTDDRGIPFIVMEFLDGETLERRLRRERRLSPRAAVAIVLQAAQGLRVVHAAGVVHRDLKPSNLFLCPRDAGPLVKIVDFGVAKSNEPGDETLTHAGAIVGTAAYMSPEQARGARDVDVRTDIHALGAILYECLTGERAYPGKSHNEVIFRIASGAPTPLLDLAPWVDAALGDEVDRALSRERADRHPDMEDFLRALAPFRELPEVPMSSIPVGLSTAFDAHPSTTRSGTMSTDLSMSETGGSLDLRASVPAQTVLATTARQRSRPEHGGVSRGRVLAVVAIASVVGAVSIAKWMAASPSSAPRGESDASAAPPVRSGIDVTPAVLLQPSSDAPPMSASEVQPAMSNSVHSQATASAVASVSSVTPLGPAPAIATARPDTKERKPGARAASAMDHKNPYGP